MKTILHILVLLLLINTTEAYIGTTIERKPYLPAEKAIELIKEVEIKRVEKRRDRKLDNEEKEALVILQLEYVIDNEFRNNDWLEKSRKNCWFAELGWIYQGMIDDRFFWVIEKKKKPEFIGYLE